MVIRVNSEVDFNKMDRSKEEDYKNKDLQISYQTAKITLSLCDNFNRQSKIHKWTKTQDSKMIL